jgi:hypothetical protein
MIKMSNDPLKIMGRKRKGYEEEERFKEEKGHEALRKGSEENQKWESFEKCTECPYVLK